MRRRVLVFFLYFTYLRARLILNCDCRAFYLNTSERGKEKKKNREKPTAGSAREGVGFVLSPVCPHETTNEIPLGRARRKNQQKNNNNGLPRFLAEKNVWRKTDTGKKIKNYRRDRAWPNIIVIIVSSYNRIAGCSTGIIVFWDTNGNNRIPHFFLFFYIYIHDSRARQKGLEEYGDISIVFLRFGEKI